MPPPSGPRAPGIAAVVLPATVARTAEVLGGGLDPHLDSLAPGERIVGYTRGQVSMLDIIAACLRRAGPAHLVIATWTVGIRDAEAAKWLLEEGRVLSLRFMVDAGFPQRQPEYARAMRRLFGDDCIVVAPNHAKFALVVNDEWKLTVLGSMNLNRNQQLEHFSIDTSPEVCAFWLHLVDVATRQFPGGWADERIAARDVFGLWGGRWAEVASARVAQSSRVVADSDVRPHGAAAMARREAVALGMAAGHVAGEIAAATGLATGTVENARREPWTQARAAELRAEALGAARRRLIDGAARAGGLLVELLDDVECPSAVKVRAAAEVLDRVGVSAARVDVDNWSGGETTTAAPGTPEWLAEQVELAAALPPEVIAEAARRQKGG